MKKALVAGATTLALLGATGCATGPKKQVTGLQEVDGLVGRVERVHFEAEIARARSREALETLRLIVSDEFRGDPVVAYGHFVETVEVSVEQAESLQESLEPLHEAAEDVFGQWREDLETFSTERLRQRSAARLKETKKRYDQVVAAVEHASKLYGSYNQGLEDHVLFLGHDFNAASVAEIRREVETMGTWAAELDNRLGAVLTVAEEYVRAAALPGTIDLPGDEVALREEL